MGTRQIVDRQVRARADRRVHPDIAQIERLVGEHPCAPLRAGACGKLQARPRKRETLSLQAKKGGCIPPKHRLDLLQARSYQ
jgi:hypothetical protein